MKLRPVRNIQILFIKLQNNNAFHKSMLVYFFCNILPQNGIE